MCDRGADVEAFDNFGSRPLHFAAFFGHISVVKELIEERNAEINARDKYGRTALRLSRDIFGLALTGGLSKLVAAYLVSRGGIE